MIKIYEINDNAQQLNKNRQAISLNDDINITEDYSLLISENSTFEALKFISSEPCIILEQDIYDALIIEHATNAYDVINNGNGDNWIAETIYCMLNLESKTNVKIDVDFENVSNESKIHIRPLSRNFLNSHQKILLKMYQNSKSLQKYYK